MAMLGNLRLPFVTLQIAKNQTRYYQSLQICRHHSSSFSFGVQHPQKYSTNVQTDSHNKKLVVVEQIENVRTIGINRPEKRNCVNIPTAEALLQAFKDFDAHEESKVAVLYGVGGNFCAGYDLEELSSDPDIISKIEEYGRGPMGPSRYETTKPVIAAVEGYAVAGGLELSLWCDVRIMEENAIMGVFCRRWGVPLIDGGAVRLPSIVGLGRALDIIMTGRPVRAPEALQIGLANKVVACGSALGRAIFYAEALAKYPQEALRADRNTARQAAFFSQSMQEALRSEHERGLHALIEARKGAANFVKGQGRHGTFSVPLNAFENEDKPTESNKKDPSS